MQTELIQRQYDEVIAPRYDQDPQSVYRGSHDRAVAQIKRWLPPADDAPLKALDVGLGTGLFLARLRAELDRPVQAHGLDQSAKMIEVARQKLPDLTAVVADAQHLGEHFQNDTFDLISTHYITGYVPIDQLAPVIWDRLGDGCHWSIIGGTKQGFPALQKKAESKLLQKLFGGQKLELDKVVCNPANQAEFVAALERHGFVLREAETYQPPLEFKNLDQFLEFAYYGGWLTPFVEALGLHQAKGVFKFFLNTFVFPVQDHHSIEVLLAQKGERA